MAKLIFVVFAVLLIGVYGQQDNANTTTPEPSTTTPEPSTTTPEPATTTPEPATTTPEPATTTPEPATTTPEPATTTPEPATTTAAPQPSSDEFFRVTENNITCVMYGGDVTFSVSFEQKSGKIGKATVHVPQPGINASTTGSCNTTVTGIQYIEVFWGSPNTTSSFQLQFNETSSGSKWMLTNVTAKLFIDSVTFPNATDAGKFLFLAGEFPGLSNVAVDTNSSLTCGSAVDSKNFSVEVSGSTGHSYTATGNAVGVKLQAFNSIPNMRELQQGMRCEADVTSDLVPIAVGCALAGLVLLVLISYLVGRRRRAAAYQSV